jgi:hypothetical protein
MKFRLYKHRTAAHVKVPLATPEIIELNEIISAPFSVQEHYQTSSPILNDNRDELINSSSSIIDSSKQTRGTDSSVDSSSDERLQTSTPTVENVATLQRKVSDRKIKRVRTKQNDVTGSASSSEVLKKRM